MTLSDTPNDFKYSFAKNLYLLTFDVIVLLLNKAWKIDEYT